MATYTDTPGAHSFSDPSALADKIYGLDGNDTVTLEHGGADTVFGGAGNDKLDGSLSHEDLVLVGDAYSSSVSGNDTLIGGSGHNYLIGGDGINQLFGGHGNDTMIGGKGIDYFFSGLNHSATGNDVMIGGDFYDVFFVGTGDDTIYGGKGDDTVRADFGHKLIHGGEGGDFIVSDGGSTIHGDEGKDLILGSEKIFGDEGNDHLAGFGVDAQGTLHGGAGDDSVHSGSDAGHFYLMGDEGDDTISSSVSQDTLHGGEGNDVVCAYLDTVQDILYGDEGNDAFYFTPNGTKHYGDPAYPSNPDYVKDFDAQHEGVLLDRKNESALGHSILTGTARGDMFDSDAFAVIATNQVSGHLTNEHILKAIAGIAASAEITAASVESFYLFISNATDTALAFVRDDLDGDATNLTVSDIYQIATMKGIHGADLEHLQVLDVTDTQIHPLP